MNDSDIDMTRSLSAATGYVAFFSEEGFSFCDLLVLVLSKKQSVTIDSRYIIDPVPLEKNRINICDP